MMVISYLFLGTQQPNPTALQGRLELSVAPLASVPSNVGGALSTLNTNTYNFFKSSFHLSWTGSAIYKIFTGENTVPWIIRNMTDYHRCVFTGYVREITQQRYAM